MPKAACRVLAGTRSELGCREIDTGLVPRRPEQRPLGRRRTHGNASQSAESEPDVGNTPIRNGDSTGKR
jgi:hypothetical protein